MSDRQPQPETDPRFPSGRWIGFFVQKHPPPGKHSVYYEGYNEGQGIWGAWHIPAGSLTIEVSGGFHIWPEEMPDPTGRYLHEHADVPAELVSV